MAKQKQVVEEEQPIEKKKSSKKSKVVEEEQPPVEEVPKKSKKSKKEVVPEEEVAAASEEPLEKKKAKLGKKVKAESEEAPAEKKVSKGKKTCPKPEALNVEPIQFSKLGSNTSKLTRYFHTQVFNERATTLDKELKDHKESLIAATNLKDGYVSYHGFTPGSIEFLRELKKSYVEQERARYERQRFTSILEPFKTRAKDSNCKPEYPENINALIVERKRALVSGLPLQPVYEKFDKNFYKGFKVESEINEKVGEPAFKFYKSLVNRYKYRVNSKALKRLTLFLKLVLSHVVNQVIEVRQEENKNKNLQSKTHYLSSLVYSLATWNSEEFDLLLNNAKYNLPRDKVGSLVSDAFRGLSVEPKEGVKFNKIVFRKLLLELVANVSETLRTLLRLRHDKNLDVDMVNTLIETYHFTYNLGEKLEYTQNQLNDLVHRHEEWRNDESKKKSALKKKAAAAKGN